MTQWRIDPTAVQGILDTIQEQNEDLSKIITEDSMTATFSGLDGGGAITADVPTALSSLFEDQQGALSTIANGIAAGGQGVGNATIAYNRGQEDMAATYQREAASAAESGDFSYFEEHGYAE